MIVVRRLYQYGIAFVSLIMLTIGLSGLGGVVIDVLAPPASVAGTGLITGFRSQVTQNAALVLVGLPVWLLHWVMAGRALRREPEERGAVLRRLYLYAVLAVMAVRWAVSAHGFLATAGRALTGSLVGDGVDTPTLRALLSPIPWIVVSALVWAYHRRVAVTDRHLAGEAGGSATLRRWYRYGLALGGLLLLLNGAAGLLRLTWENVVGGALQTTIRVGPGAIPGAAATALVGLALWVSHWSGWATGWDGGGGPARPGSAQGADAEDALSLLRPVYLFLALGISVAVTLSAAAQMLFYGLGRLLGVARPGGVGGSLALAMAGPVSVSLVFGLSWVYHRRAIAAQAGAQPELPRQAGVRRLYTYLVALIALGVLATGAGGLLWTLADAVTSAPRTINRADWWREQVSFYATLVVVGLPVWLLHWGPVSGPAGHRWTAAEPVALARRLYLYLTLLIGVLVLLGSGAAAAKQLLDLTLGEAATSGALTNLARAVAVAAVSGVTVFYHQRVLRADTHLAGPGPEPSGLRGDEGIPEGVVTEREGPGIPSPQRPFGLIYRRGTAEASEWFATGAEASSALQRVRNAGNGVTWAAVVRLEERLDGPAGQVPSGPTGPGAPRATEAPPGT